MSEQNPHLVDTAVSPDRVQLVLFVQPPDRFDFFADFWGAKFLDSLTDVLVPRSKYNNVGFDFTSVVEKRTRFVESLECGAALTLI